MKRRLTIGKITFEKYVLNFNRKRSKKVSAHILYHMKKISMSY